MIDALNINGLALQQFSHERDGGVAIETRLIHESGEVIDCGVLFVPATKQDAQGYGSALTYARRYSLMAACAFGAACTARIAVEITPLTATPVKIFGALLSKKRPAVFKYGRISIVVPFSVLKNRKPKVPVWDHRS